jgi:condensin complex subunit 1
MAKCTEDEDRRIRDMSRMFFTELATKDNAVYNHFVDMFSLLSADGKLGEDAFRRIIKFLLGFIEKVCVLFLIFISAGIIGFHRSIVLLMKQLANPTWQDKHAKQLANKLTARLQRCESERQWNDVAFALGLLQHKDEEIQKVVADGFKLVQAAA